MNFIEQIVQYIIRPARENYSIKRLGPSSIRIQSTKTNKTLTYTRQDYQVTNIHNQKI
jgi:hypothetical protein